jgi:hypothetical protein
MTIGSYVYHLAFLRAHDGIREITDAIAATKKTTKKGTTEP